MVFGFPIWTFGIICGAIWADQAWGRYWGWDPVETWAFITWVVYACFLHARATAGWRGKRAAYIQILGFCCLLFNVLVVQTSVTGLHSYAWPGHRRAPHGRTFLFPGGLQRAGFPGGLLRSCLRAAASGQLGWTADGQLGRRRTASHTVAPTTNVPATTATQAALGSRGHSSLGVSATSTRQ